MNSIASKRYYSVCRVVHRQAESQDTYAITINASNDPPVLAPLEHSIMLAIQEICAFIEV